ncbi:MAG TPA: Ig-like domain-containing protein [Phycisphaerae bacterium]|nr:Ig-like domain-containing protein [Phycisphaerae bacterium]
MWCFPVRLGSGLAALLTMLMAAAPVQGLSEDEIRAKYLAIVEESVKSFEPLWTDYSNIIPRSGFFDFRKYNNWEPPWYVPEITVPGNGHIIFCYAVLLAETEKETFTDRNIPRAVLLDHAVKAIRWCCLTSAYVDRPYPFPIEGSHDRRIRNGSWVRPAGHRTDVLGWFTVGTAMLWNQLDAETKKLVEQVCIGAAPKERFIRTWEYGQGGNHDVVKQDMSSTIGAAFLFPRRTDRGLYLDLVRAAGIDLVSTAHDRASTAVADGRPVGDWHTGINLYEDYSSDHHGWAQTWYGLDLLFEARSYIEILSRLTGVPVPETYFYPGNGFTGVQDWAETLSLPEGEPANVHGMEYDAYYGAGLLAYCYAAVSIKDPISAAFEDRAAELLERHSRAIPQYDYHRNSAAKAAAAYLLHKYLGPRPEPITMPEAWQVLNGTHHYRWQQTLVHRANDRWASFSWGSISRQERPRPCGFIVPTRNFTAAEPLVYFHPESMAGSATVQPSGATTRPAGGDSYYRHTCSDAGFGTAGVAADENLSRYHAAWSFDNGPFVTFAVFRTMMPGQITWTGLPLYFYVRPGLTGARRYHDAEGHAALEQTLDRKSTWWCVADALGLIATGGNGRIHVERSAGFNWARTPDYRDKCDGVFVSPIHDITVGTGDMPVDLAAAIYPDRPFDQIAEAAKTGGQTSLALPEGWKGLVAPDVPPTGKRFLAVANLFGKDTQAALSLTFAEGAPVLSSETTLVGRIGTCSLALAGMETFGQALELYVEVLDGKTVFARRLSTRLYEFRPMTGEKARVRLRFRGKGAQTLIIRSVAGEGARRIRLTGAAEARPVDIDLAEPTYVGIEGPAYEDLIGPAVEISSLTVREDGRVTVEAVARDRSGLQVVDLYCDGQPLGPRTSDPYIWAHKPRPGWHTYQAVALDASPQANTRASFKRTILVAPQEGSLAAPAQSK